MGKYIIKQKEILTKMECYFKEYAEGEYRLPFIYGKKENAFLFDSEQEVEQIINLIKEKIGEEQLKYVFTVEKTP